MRANYQTPGVYRAEIALQAAAALQTGVPGLIGFVKSSFAELVSEPVSLSRMSEFDALFKGQAEGYLAPGSYLAEAVNGFFLNGGVRCYVVCAAIEDNADTESKEEALNQALRALSTVTDLDLIVVPDAMTLSNPDATPAVEAIKRVQSEMLKHCEVNGNRMAILDSLPGATVEDVIEQCDEITTGLREPISGALYYPWLRNDQRRLIPPSGHVAGIFSRSDSRVGVFKAPANEEVLGALDLGVEEESGLVIDSRVQDRLNPAGINCLRAFPGRGIRVWGARTLSRDPLWRYVNVRRLVLTLHRWIEMNMTWVSFEPNTLQLWVRIRRELTTYLTELWQAGALHGQTPEQAFYVKCDAETNPAESREAGQAVTEIGLAPDAPAEFVVVRIVHHIGVEPR
jgi:phage tail sheath protein FI